MNRRTLRVGAVCGALILGLVGAGSVAQATDTSESRSAIRPNAKCVKANAAITVVVKGKTLQCKRGKGGYFWRVVRTPATPSQPVQATGPLQRLNIIPEWGNNSLFTMNQRFAPEIGQTVTLNESISLESLTLDPQCITSVPLSYYSGQNQDHSLEQVLCQYPDIDITVTTSIYKVSDAFTLNPSRYLVSALTPITKVTAKQSMRLASPFTVALNPAVRLDPGYYAITFGFELTDPTINTIWFGGHNFTQGTQPPCAQNVGSDVYPSGSAYRGEPNNAYTGLADNFRGFADMFLMHTAKVQPCIGVGNYTGDVFANGDLNLVLAYRTFSR